MFAHATGSNRARIPPSGHAPVAEEHRRPVDGALVKETPTLLAILPARWPPRAVVLHEATAEHHQSMRDHRRDSTTLTASMTQTDGEARHRSDHPYRTTNRLQRRQPPSPPHGAGLGPQTERPTLPPRLHCHDYAGLSRGRAGRQGRAFGPRFARP